LKKESREKESVQEKLKSMEGESQKQIEDVMKGLDEQHKLVKRTVVIYHSYYTIVYDF
jgi:hypothetical protein